MDTSPLHSDNEHDLPQLIDHLIAQGMGWADLTKIAGVSVVMLRRYRCGLTRARGSQAREVKNNLRGLMVIIASNVEPLSWLLSPLPLPRGYTVCPHDIYENSDERREYLRQLALDLRSAASVLDEIEPTWREKWYSPNDIVISSDDSPSIVPHQ